MVCAICVAPILAAAGAGGFGSSALTDKQKKRKTNMYIDIDR